MSDDASRPLWAGRMQGELSGVILRFSASLPVDRALFHYDVRASRAHVEMLGRQGLLSSDDSSALVAALGELPAPTGDEADEDVHSYIERLLRERLGPLGARVHAGRSRNDQVATATRLWARDACRALALAAAALQEALGTAAETGGDAVLPGYTHLQRAQPILYGHLLAAHAWSLERDVARFRAADGAADACPLGAGALAGSSLGLDPAWTAQRLGFSRTFANSVDAVSDRDFVLDLVYACTVCQVHLSRLAEEVVIYTSQEFGFLTLADEVALGSSMMPQKKNPQVAEHLRGRSGAAIGRLAGLLATCKALPLAYDSDLQEDKEALFAQVAATLAALEAAALLVAGLRVERARMREAAADGLSVATDVAEALVRSGTPFRDAHEQVASRVAAGERFASPTPEEAVAARDSAGGTAAPRVAEQWDALRSALAVTRDWARS